MYASFHRVRGLGYMTVPECRRQSSHKIDLFDMFSVFSYVVHIFGMVPSTLHCVLQNDHSVRCMKTYMYLRSTMGQQRVSNIALINIETYVGSLKSTMTWIVSLISSAVKMVETAINVFFELMR